MSGRLDPLRADDAGSSLVEFALSAVVLLMLLFGIMDCSRALYIDHFVANAAREATRYAAVRGSGWSGTRCVTSSTFACMASAADVTAFVRTIVPNGIDPAKMTVMTQWPGTDATGASCTGGGTTANGAGCVVIVKIVYRFTFVLPLLPTTTLAMPSTSQVTIAQ